MRGVKTNPRRVGIEANGSSILNPGPWIGRALEFYFTVLSLRNLSKGIRSVVEHVGAARPMLLIFIPFGQRPKLVAAVVEPLAWVRRQVFSFVLGIDEQKWMAAENHLHQPSAILGNDDQLHPPVGHLLRVPALVIRGFYAAR